MTSIGEARLATRDKFLQLLSVNPRLSEWTEFLPRPPSDQPQSRSVWVWDITGETIERPHISGPGRVTLDDEWKMQLDCWAIGGMTDGDPAEQAAVDFIAAVADVCTEHRELDLDTILCFGADLSNVPVGPKAFETPNDGFAGVASVEITLRTRLI